MAEGHIRLISVRLIPNRLGCQTLTSVTYPELLFVECVWPCEPESPVYDKSENYVVNDRQYILFHIIFNSGVLYADAVY